MNCIFDMSEQLAELHTEASMSPIHAISTLSVKQWGEFIREDAAEILREKHRGGLNDRTTRLLELLTNFYWAGGREGAESDSQEIGDRYNRYRQYSRELSEDLGTSSLQTDPNVPRVKTHTVPDEAVTYLHALEDALDRLYYEIGNELQEFVDGFYTKGDMWQVELIPSSKFLVFTFCCRRSDVESAVRASGGNMGDFISHIIG